MPVVVVVVGVAIVNASTSEEAQKPTLTVTSPH